MDFLTQNSGTEDKRMSKIDVLYVTFDEPEISQVIIQRIRETKDVNVVCVSGDKFPFAKQLLTVPEVLFKVIILHMMAGCHELGYNRETDQCFSTGLRRAEILREQGYEGEIILLSTANKDLRRRTAHDYSARVQTARVHFCGYGNIGQDIIDMIREVAK